MYVFYKFHKQFLQLFVMYEEKMLVWHIIVYHLPVIKVKVNLSSAH